MCNEIFIIFGLLIVVYLLSIIIRAVWIVMVNKQSGGSRSAVFSRFHYLPQYPFMSKLDTVDLNVFSKIYNVPQRLEIIMGRPYRNYRMADGNWGYPWHFPEPADHTCLQLAEERCGEEAITLLKTPDQKLGGLGVETPKDIVRPSKCFDYVYKQCRAGIDPLLIKVKYKGVYEQTPTV